jgi:MFS family permease
MLLLYFPSLLIRYSVHFLTIALPWIMQMQNKTLSSIADVFSFFFLGCIFGCMLVYRFIGVVRMSLVLRICLILQTIFFVGSFFIENPFWLNFVRFFYGMAFGIFRPANQIWVNEFEHSLSKTQLAQRQTYSKLMVSMGLFLAGVVGSFAKWVINDPIMAIIYVAFFFGVPKIVMFSLFFSQDLRYKEGAKKTFNLQYLKEEKEQGSFFLWILTRPRTFFCVLIHAVCMFGFSSWFLFVPYEIRRNAIQYGIANPDFFLSVFFPMHSVIFSFVQYLMARSLGWFKVHLNMVVVVVAAVTCLQSILIWSAFEVVSNVYLMVCMLILGASIIAAVIYPLLMLLIFSELHDDQSSFTRKILILLSFSSDIGQFFGAYLLRSGQIPSYLVGAKAILIPAYLCVLVSFLVFGLLSRKPFQRSLSQLFLRRKPVL